MAISPEKFMSIQPKKKTTRLLEFLLYAGHLAARESKNPPDRRREKGGPAR
jgi:hypothetical protein